MLDAEFVALEAEQRRADEAARRQAAGRREAERRRAEAKRDEKRKARRTALVGVPGGVELFLANLADLDPKWNVDGNEATTGANIDAALDAAESDGTRLGRLRDVVSDEAGDARFRRELRSCGGRFGTADLDDAVATAEALRKRVSRVRELFGAPGGDAALVAALEDRNRSWPHTGTPVDIERALDVAEQRPDRRQAATWEHRVVLEAEQAFPDVPSTGWRRTGEGFKELTETGRPARRLTRTLSDRARVLAIAAERPEPPASLGLVKRLFEWVRERVERLLARFRPSKAAHRLDHSPGGDVEPAGPVAAEREPVERDLAGQLVAAAGTAARKWGKHHPGHGHPDLRRGVDRRSARDDGGSAGGPRADQLGGGALGQSLDRGRRIGRPLPGREGRGGRRTPSAGPRRVERPAAAAALVYAKAGTTESRPAEPTRSRGRP